MGRGSDRAWMGPRALAVSRRLEPFMLAAALLTVPTIVLEEIAVRESGRVLAIALNWTIWCAFAGEMAVMLVLVRDRWRWLRTHPLEVAIVVLTPPFLPAVLEILRTFRLVRIVRLLPLVRAVMSARRVLSLEGLRFVGLITLSLILIAGLAFSRLERGPDGGELSTWDGVWWAVTTVTTVGYGDLSPETGTGRALAVGVMMLGIGFVAMLTAAAAERFMSTGLSDDAEDESDIEHLRRQVDEMRASLARIEATLARREAGSARQRDVPVVADERDPQP